MKITIKYFGAIAEVTGSVEETIDSKEISSLDSLRNYTISKYEGLNELSFQLAVNQSLAENTKLKDGDEVAFLPPFAGG